MTLQLPSDTIALGIRPSVRLSQAVCACIVTGNRGAAAGVDGADGVAAGAAGAGATPLT